MASASSVMNSRPVKFWISGKIRTSIKSNDSWIADQWKDHIFFLTSCSNDAPTPAPLHLQMTGQPELAPSWICISKLPVFWPWIPSHPVTARAAWRWPSASTSIRVWRQRRQSVSWWPSHLIHFHFSFISGTWPISKNNMKTCKTRIQIHTAYNKKLYKNKK